MNIHRELSITGDLQTKKIPAPSAPLDWRMQNALRWSFVRGGLAHFLAKPIAKTFGLLTAVAELSGRVKTLTEIERNRYFEMREHGGLQLALAYARTPSVGHWVNYGVLSYRVITDAGVAYLVDDWDAGGSDINLMDFHGCGTGTNAEAVGDVALQTESTTALNPDSTRATGTNSQPAANQFRTIGTLTFDASAAVTEHGIFNQTATGGGSLWDRSQFAAINVSSGDSIQFTYTCTVSSGG